MGIPEADWKIWRRLSHVALERYCARVLDEAAQFSQGTDSAHQRYLNLYAHIHDCNKQIAMVFDGLRRSTAYESLALAVRREMLTPDELREFSQETQDVINRILN